MNELQWTAALLKFVKDKFGDQVKIGRERRLWDGTRVDLLTDNYAVEVDWATKWAEAIGQALYYAEMTSRPPGIVLLIKDFKREEKYVYRCKVLCAKHNIFLWLVDTHKDEVIDSNGVRHEINSQDRVVDPDDDDDAGSGTN